METNSWRAPGKIWLRRLSVVCTILLSVWLVPPAQTDARILQAKSRAGGGTGLGFGAGLALSSNTLVVGAPGVQPSGAVYVFTRAQESWRLRDVVTPADRSDSAFGSAVALSGEMLVVASEVSAELFVYDQGKWSLSKRVPFGGAFRPSISAEGNTVAIGIGGYGGHGVWVLTRTATGWSTLLLPPRPYFFGDSVAVNAGRILVGASDAGSNATVAAGRVYLFKHAGVAWNLQHTFTSLKVTNGWPEEGFGQQVGLQGNSIVILDGVDTLIYAYDGSTWREQVRLKGFNGDFALAENVAVFASSQAKQAAAWLFTRDTGTWRRKALLIAGDDHGDQAYAYALAATNERVALGDSSSGSGAVYLFTKHGSTWQQEAKLTTQTTTG